MILRQFLHSDPVAASYLFGCGGKASGAVVDPVGDIAPYLQAAQALGMRILYVIDTHLHADDKTLVLMDLLGRIAQQNLSVVDDILQGLSDGVAPEPITRAELSARLKEGSVTLLDMRPEDEYAMGHIPGALQVDLSRLDAMAATLNATAEIIAYCRGPFCVYAHQAVARLRQLGLKARRLEGGLPEWRADGRQVATA